MVRALSFRDPVYEQYVTIALGPRTDLDAWNAKYYPGSKVPEDISESRASGARWAITHEPTGNVHQIVWVEMFSEDVEDLGLLVHETNHCAIAILSRIGGLEGKLSPSNDEPLVYYSEYLFEVCLKALRGFHVEEKKSRAQVRRRARATRSGDRKAIRDRARKR